jgi:hypothetical protein
MSDSGTERLPVHHIRSVTDDFHSPFIDTFQRPKERAANSSLG